MTPSPVDRTREHLEVLADALTLPSEGAKRYSSTARESCYCCGRPGCQFSPLVRSDKGWVCAQDDFCRAGTSEARGRP